MPHDKVGGINGHIYLSGFFYKFSIQTWRGIYNLRFPAPAPSNNLHNSMTAFIQLTTQEGGFDRLFKKLNGTTSALSPID